MIIQQAIAPGLQGEQLSRVITGTSEVSAGRSAVAAGSGALLGAGAAGAVAVGASALGISALAAVAAPAIAPLPPASDLVALFQSWWD